MNPIELFSMLEVRIQLWIYLLRIPNVTLIEVRIIISLIYLHTKWSRMSDQEETKVYLNKSVFDIIFFVKNKLKNNA